MEYFQKLSTISKEDKAVENESRGYGLGRTRWNR